jgi:hypothetical protein
LNSTNSAREDVHVAITEEAGEVTYAPNPVKDQLNIQFNGHQFRRLVVIDALGRIHHDMDLDSEQREVNLDLGKLNQGTYLIRLKGERSNKLVRIIKQ